jgi:N-acetylglucosaminyl-diphospho-decaprenol L-rhamnosyltransferase
VTVDVVIPTHDAEQLVLSCLDRLARASGEHHVIVVDDASRDGTVDAVERLFADASVVQLDEHRGLAHALNRGSAAGRGELVLFLNNDVLAERTALERLVRALERDPQAVAAGGRLVDPGTSQTQSAYQPRALPGLAALVVRVVGIERVWPRNPWTGLHLTAPLHPGRIQRTERQPAGACLMVRRHALERVGGWDERYSMWYEDVDLARRLAALGPALYVPDAVFEHIGAASTRRWRKHEQHLRLYHGTMVYAQAHLPRAQRIVLALVMAAVCAPRLVIGGEVARTYRALLRKALRMLR